jgi:hypothetical protein
MATKTLWFYDVAVGSYGKLDEGTQPSIASTLTKGTGTLNANVLGEGESPCTYNSTVTITDGTFNGAAAPNGSNGLRSLNPYTGTFAAGNWQVAIEGISNNVATSSYGFFWRLFRSTNATGSGATEITSGSEVGISSSCSGLTNTQTQSFSAGSPITFHNEYLFLTLSCDLSTARTVATGITATLQTGATAVTTPNFTPADFVVSASPGTQSVTQGSGTSYTVTVTPSDGYATNVTLSLSGNPSGVSGSFVTNPVTGGSGTSTLNITTTGSAAPGSYTLTIQGTDGTLTHTTTVTLVVLGPTFRLIALGTTNANAVKLSSGQIIGWYLFNASGATRYLKFYNKASAPTVGTDTPTQTIAVPSGAATNVKFEPGIAFSTGIALAITANAADADTTAVSAGDLIINVYYL